MATINFYLFGHIKVMQNSRDGEIRLTRANQLLLAYLLLERNHLHPRDVLANLFWSDRDQHRARNCLNTALFRLRQAFEENSISPDTFLIYTQTGEIGFNVDSDYWLDVAVFEKLASEVLSRPVETVSAFEAKAFENGLSIYSGELLEGVYEDWAVRAREEKRLLYLSGLSFLMQFYRQQKIYEKSLEFAQKILDLDPLREEIHREMMQLYLARGQRALAARQYEICRQSLRIELGIPPMEETEVIYRQIVGGSDEQQPSGNGREKQDLQIAIQQMRQATKNFELAQEQYRRALYFLEKYSKTQRERKPR